MKTCSSCGVVKPNRLFYKRAVGISSRCKACEVKSAYVWKQNNKEKNNAINRKALLKRKYGITPEIYEELLASQNFQCAVCHKPSASFTKRLAIDHDHATGEIRGLLCTHCNHRVVGRHKKGGLLKPASDYIEGEYTGYFVPPPKKRKRK